MATNKSAQKSIQDSESDESQFAMLGVRTVVQTISSEQKEQTARRLIKAASFRIEICCVRSARYGLNNIYILYNSKIHDFAVKEFSDEMVAKHGAALPPSSSAPHVLP